MEYKIDKFDSELKKFLFIFSDKNWIYIDIFNDYPNYTTPKNNIADEWWDFTLTKKLNNSTSKFNIGDVIKINYLDLRNKNTLVKEYHINGLIFKPTTQSELDKYYNKIDKLSDNSKLYEYLIDMYLNNSRKRNKIQETII